MLDLANANQQVMLTRCFDFEITIHLTSELIIQLKMVKLNFAASFLASAWVLFSTLQFIVPWCETTCFLRHLAWLIPVSVAQSPPQLPCICLTSHPAVLIIHIITNPVTMHIYKALIMLSLKVIIIRGPITAGLWHYPP